MMFAETRLFQTNLNLLKLCLISKEPIIIVLHECGSILIVGKKIVFLFRCMKKFEIGCSSNSFKDYIAESKTTMNNQLNNAPASFEGVLLRITKGVYYYMCTRNNNFTNRSQRGKITVK